MSVATWAFIGGVLIGHWLTTAEPRWITLVLGCSAFAIAIAKEVRR